MRLFIKKSAKDKLTNLVKEGGGFQNIEVLAADDFEKLVPEPERPDWIEIYPSWEFNPIKVSLNECGLLLGFLGYTDPQTRMMIDNVWKQLVALKKKAEEDAGVTKELLPDGMIQIIDRDGNKFTRPALPYEIELN